MVTSVATTLLLDARERVASVALMMSLLRMRTPPAVCAIVVLQASSGPWDADTVLRLMHGASMSILVKNEQIHHSTTGATNGPPGCAADDALAVNFPLPDVPPLNATLAFAGVLLSLRSLEAPVRWAARARHVLLLDNTAGARAHDSVRSLAENIRDLLRTTEVLAATPMVTKDVFLVARWLPNATAGCSTSGSKSNRFEARGRCFFEGDIDVKLVNALQPFPRLFTEPATKLQPGCEIIAEGASWPPYVISGTSDKPDHGFEVLLLRAAAERLGAQLRLRVRDGGVWKEAVKCVREGDADLALGGFFHLAQYEVNYDATATYWLEPTLWYVPARLPAPRWLSVGRVFSATLWGAVGVAAATVALAPVGPGLLDVVRIAIAVGAVRPARSLRDRVALTAWLLPALVLSAAYQSALVSFLADPGLLPGITSVDQMLRSRLIFGMHNTSADFLKNVDGSKAIFSRKVECQDHESCFKRVAKKRDMAFPIEVSYAEWMIGSFTEDDKRLIVAIPPSIFTLQNIMVLPNDSYLQSPLDSLFAAATEGGLVEHWWRETMRYGHAARRSGSTNNGASNSEGPFVMNTSHLQGAFALLGIGVAMASVVFMAEFCHKYY